MIDKVFKLGLEGLLNYFPSERVTLGEVLRGKNRLKLSDGSDFEISIKEAEEAARKVPVYLWELVKLPVVILKLPYPGAYTVEDHKWNRELLKYLLNKEDASYISVGEVEKLIRDYKSLVFISLSVSVTSGTEDREEV